MATITVKLARTRYGHTPKQRATLAVLGLTKIRQERSFEKTATVVGMEKIFHNPSRRSAGFKYGSLDSMIDRKKETKYRMFDDTYCVLQED